LRNRLFAKCREKLHRLQAINTIVQKDKEIKMGKQINRESYKSFSCYRILWCSYAIHLVNFLISEHARRLGIAQNRLTIVLTIALRTKTACSLRSSRNRVEIFDCWCLPEKCQISTMSFFTLRFEEVPKKSIEVLLDGFELAEEKICLRSFNFSN